MTKQQLDELNVLQKNIDLLEAHKQVLKARVQQKEIRNIVVEFDRGSSAILYDVVLPMEKQRFMDLYMMELDNAISLYKTKLDRAKVSY